MAKNNNNDYTEQNLVKLYELEKERAKLDEMVEHLYREEGRVTSPEILMQSGKIQAMINEEVLGEILSTADKDFEIENKEEKKK